MPNWNHKFEPSLLTLKSNHSLEISIETEHLNANSRSMLLKCVYSHAALVNTSRHSSVHSGDEESWSKALSLAVFCSWQPSVHELVNCVKVFNFHPLTNKD